MAEPLLTVVTVTFRDLPGLERTLSSLAPLVDQAGLDIQCLVQDGGTPGVDAVTTRYPWAILESSSDGGIYPGMNRAIARSTGRHIWFLNGGDVNLVDDWQRLKPTLESNDGGMTFADYSLDINGTLVPRTSRPTRYILHALPTSHQAIFYPGSYLRAHGYDLSYRIVGDYALTAKLISQGVPVKRERLPVAAFSTGGTSQQHAAKLAIEARRVQRDILRAPLPVQVASKALHSLSRWRRERATRHR